MNPANVLFLLAQLPGGIKSLEAVVEGIQAIMASDATKRVEQGIADLINHLTPGKPNSPALGPDAAKASGTTIISQDALPPAT